jgi:hypothetical protein
LRKVSLLIIGRSATFYQEKGGHGEAAGQKPAGGVGQDCAQGESLFGGGREAGGVGTMVDVYRKVHE